MKLSAKNLVSTSLAVLLLLSPAYTKPVFSQNQLALMSEQEAAQIKSTFCSYKCSTEGIIQHAKCM